MAIRVYALAKELKLSPGELLDLCCKLKIIGKGASVLTSISDEDAVRIREYVKSGNFRAGE